MVRTPESGSPSPTPSASPLFPPSTPGATTSPATSVETSVEHDELQVDFSRDKENRDSNISTITVTPATIVRHVSVAKRARANVVKSPPRATHRRSTYSSISSSVETEDAEDQTSARSDSPASSASSSSDISSTAIPLPKSTASKSPLGDENKWTNASPERSNLPYVESSPQPSPRVGNFLPADIINPATVREFRQQEEIVDPPQRPSIVIDDLAPPSSGPSPWSASTASPSLSPSPSPLTPAQRYPGWVSEVVAPLKAFIDGKTDPRDLFSDLQEIAEGESGSVYAARVMSTPSSSADPTFVAIKQVALVPSGSAKLVDLQKELTLLKKVRHENILTMEALYVDLVEDALWIRMELMDRSLADILNLAEEGVALSEAHIAQFARDVSVRWHCC